MMNHENHSHEDVSISVLHWTECTEEIKLCDNSWDQPIICCLKVNHWIISILWSKLNSGHYWEKKATGLLNSEPQQSVIKSVYVFELVVMLHLLYIVRRLIEFFFDDTKVNYMQHFATQNCKFPESYLITSKQRRLHLVSFKREISFTIF